MLENFNVVLTSPLKYENIRHPVTRKMTGILNGNRFAYAKPFPDGGYIPRTTYCAGLKCFVYHEGQPSQKRKALCTNCWKDDHFRNQCKNAKCCKVCHKEGHEPGSQLCDAYVESQNSVRAFAGKDMILSNFYPTTIDIFGVKHRSAEHAFQYVKALRCGDLQRATAIKDAKTALDAKRISKEITVSEQFRSKQIEIMTEILDAKAKQVKDFREILVKNGKNVVFAEATYDDFWGTGLDKTATIHTSMKKWPGKNQLGQLLCDVASAYTMRASSQRSVSLPRQNAKQADIGDMFKTIRSSRKRNRVKRNSHDHSSRDSSPRQRSKSIRRNDCTKLSHDDQSGSSSDSDKG